MYKIPTILTSDEILDKAFKKAAKVQVVAKDRTKRNKKTAQAKVTKAANTISSTLNKFVKSFPSFDSLSDFYYELFDVSLGINRLKKSLGALSWCAKKTEKIKNDVTKNIARAKSQEEIKKLISSSYGRLSSIVHQISGDLILLDDARRYLQKTPVIDPEKPTIVIAGAPNVGKSLLVARISSAKPKIASYPFTTQGISVGHFEVKGVSFQVIDTPGLLDREMDQRNEMEQKGILALRHLANIIVFVLDPSEYCGYSMDSQYNILSDIKERFPSVHIIEVENKSDLAQTDSKKLKISAQDGKGMEKLMELVVSMALRHSD